MASAPNGTAPRKQFTINEVSKHKTKDNLWLILHDKVYDVTKFLNEHPGGEEILLEHGGTNSTEYFEDIGHSTDARKLKDTYCIGEIVDAEKVEKSGSSEQKILSKGQKRETPVLQPSSTESSSSWMGLLLKWVVPAVGFAGLAVYIYMNYYAAPQSGPRPK